MSKCGKEPENQQNRREFIRQIVKKTAYAVPLIVTFSKARLAQSYVPSGGRRYHDYHHD